MISAKKNSLLTISFWLWCIGFCLVTFDRVAVLPLAGFKFKAAYFFFAMSFALVCYVTSRSFGFWKLWQGLLGVFVESPWRYMLLLIVFAFSLDPFSITPVKSFGYSLWLAFDLLCIVGSAILLAKLGAFSLKGFMRALALITLLISGIILVDDMAYYVFGMRDGLIGFNQDTLLHWGVSRPQAFSYEPSYVGMFLVMTCSFLFAELCLDVGGKKKLPIIVAGSALALGLFAILATTSRSAWLAVAISISLSILGSVWKAKKIRNEIYIFCGGIFLVASLLFLVLPKEKIRAVNEKLVQSVLEMKDGSAHSRILSMEIGAKIGSATNYLGTGMGASYLFWQRQADPVKYAVGLPPDEQGAQVVMSSWLESFAELGAPGILLFFFFAITFSRALFRNARVSREPLAIAAAASALCFFFFSAHWMPNLSRSDVWVWYAVWAVMLTG